MAQVLKTIALVCLVLSALGIAVSVYLWFRLNIYKVWCDLTGRTEQKALEEIKSQRRGEKAAAGRLFRQSIQ